MDPDPGNLQHAFLFLSNLPWWPLLLGQMGLLILLIAGSFTASGAEVAYFSLSKAEIEELRNQESREAQRVWKLISLPKRLLATILITNNLMNVAAILVASNILQIVAEGLAISDAVRFLLEVVLITSLLLFFGEIIPKVYAARNRHTIVYTLALPLEVLRWLFTPLAYLLINGTNFIDKRVRIKEVNVSLDDLRHAINLTTGGEEDKDEQEILKGIVNFSNITVRSIMRARVDVKAVALDMSFAELITFIQEYTYSRLPVYEESLDHVRGVLHIKDLMPYLKEGAGEPDLTQLLRPVHFIPESKKIDALLEEFKKNRLHMAVVVDEYGGTAGVVTLEDVIEEIFGEITEEFDSEDWVYTKVSDDTFIFEGRISLIDVKKIAGLEDDAFEDARGDSDTLGGLILELHGKIPAIDDIIVYRNFELHVEGVSKHRITQVKLVILETLTEEKSED